MASKPRKPAKKKAKAPARVKVADKSPPPPPPPRRLPAVTLPPDDADPPNTRYDKDGLSPRHRAFVDALTTPGPAFGVGARAAAKAGYRDENRVSIAVTANRLLNNANIRRAVEMAYARLRDDADRRRAQLVSRASLNMADFITIGEDGKPAPDWQKAQAAMALGQIKKFKQRRIESEENPTEVETEIETHDQMEALKLLFQLDGKLKTSEGAGGTGGGITVNVNLMEGE